MAVHAHKSPVRGKAIEPAHRSPHAHAIATAMPFVDRRPEVVAQRRRIDAIQDGSLAVTQRKRLGRLFGEAAQLETSQTQEAAGAAHPARLPDALKFSLESLSRLSLDDVNVHYDSAGPEQLGALAYAQGRDIHVAPGQERHLPHEAWHVVQQAQGRVKATGQMNRGVSVNDDAGLEREADAMGARASAGRPVVQRAPARPRRSASGPAPVQRLRGKNRGKRQKKREQEQGDQPGVLPGRGKRNRARQDADLAANLLAVEERQKAGRRQAGYAAHEARVRTAQEHFEGQEQEHAVRGTRVARKDARRQASYGAHETRVSRAQQNRQEQETRHTALREKREGRTQSGQARFEEREQQLQAELRAVADAQKDAIAKKQNPGADANAGPLLSAEDQFAQKFPAAVRIGPLDSLKAALKGSDFSGHQSFVTSTFKTPSPTLPRFDGHEIYHDTQGGGQGGFTIFGVIVGRDRFLIAHGQHSNRKGVDYTLNWCCSDTVAGWDTKDVSYGK